MATKNRVIALSLARQASRRLGGIEHLEFVEAEGGEVRAIKLVWESPYKRALKIVRLLPEIWGSRLVVTDEYFNAAIVSALLWISRSPARHAVLGLNVSSNRTLRFSSPWMNALVTLIFRRIDLAVVASQPEAEIFARMHDIPRDRFAFVHWAYDLPAEEGRFERPNRPYFCLIGRNNRDHETFCAAIATQEAEGVIISQNLPTLALPANVRAYSELSLPDCIDCIRGAVANVILVNDADRGAGHITIVTAMHCARPQIISHVPTALDYFIPGQHALTVPLHDVAAARAAMAVLLADPGRADRMGAQAALHAKRWLTHKRRVTMLSERLKLWLDTGRIEWADPDWEAGQRAARIGDEDAAGDPAEEALSDLPGRSRASTSGAEAHFPAMAIPATEHVPTPH